VLASKQPTLTRNSLGEKFTPLGDHQKFKVRLFNLERVAWLSPTSLPEEMQSFKQLRDRAA
jgi:hypothetical protein